MEQEVAEQAEIAAVLLCSLRFLLFIFSFMSAAYETSVAGGISSVLTDPLRYNRRTTPSTGDRYHAIVKYLARSIETQRHGGHRD